MFFYKKEEIKISDCFHYCGFRYGNNGYNPYETYVRGIHDGAIIGNIREQFIEFLKYYRPKNMQNALSISLEKSYPLWLFPWGRRKIKEYNFKTINGWFDNPNLIPDILTHFSEKGIPSYRITQEFYWLESSYYSVKNLGYQPEKYNCFVKALCFQKSTGEKCYLLLDGNHRVSVLSALGESSVIAKVSRFIVREDNIKKWKNVRSGFYTENDAIAIFNAYFREQYIFYKDSQNPAKIIY